MRIHDAFIEQQLNLKVAPKVTVLPSQKTAASAPL